MPRTSSCVPIRGLFFAHTRARVCVGRLVQKGYILQPFLLPSLPPALLLRFRVRHRDRRRSVQTYVFQVRNGQASKKGEYKVECDTGIPPPSQVGFVTFVDPSARPGRTLSLTGL